MDLQILQDQLAGLERKGQDLRRHEAMFLKEQGLREQEEKALVDIVELDTEIAALKEEIAGLKAKRGELMAETTTKIQDSISEALPEGQAIVRIDDNGFFIGWSIHGNEKPYKALSDGEKATFNPALCKALGADLLIVEAAEADAERLKKILSQLTGFGGQVIVCTWFEPTEIPADWNVVRL